MNTIDLDKLNTDDLYNLLESAPIDSNISETELFSDEGDDEPTTLAELSNVVPSLDLQLETYREAEDAIFQNHFNYDNSIDHDLENPSEDSGSPLRLCDRNVVDEEVELESADEDENDDVSVGGGVPHTGQQVNQVPNNDPSEGIYDVPLIDRFPRHRPEKFANFL